MLKNGFLGYDASFMLDFVVTALIIIVPIQLFSLYVLKVHRNFQLHKTLQLVLGLTLLVAVTAFEVDMQMVHGGWRNIVNKSADAPRISGEKFEFIQTVLRIHLVFAISTPFIWLTTILLALKHFPSPPTPGRHSKLHKFLGWTSVIVIVGTSVTGLWFYYVAFVS